MPLEVQQIRRRVQSRLVDLRRVAADRRERVSAAERAYITFLSNVAVPVFNTFAQALSAENYPYKVMTPGSAVRLVSERSGRTYVELRLETSGPKPALVAEVTRERGSRVVTDERVVAEGVAIEDTTDEFVVEFLLEQMSDLIER
jgi:hypothetical protein